MADLPKQVKIGYRTYRIVEWTPVEAYAADRFGEHSALESVIRITMTYGYIQAANTLLHEILHGVWVAHSLHDNDNQERTVEALANGICHVWQDNPAVFEWIKAGLVEIVEGQ